MQSLIKSYPNLSEVSHLLLRYRLVIVPGALAFGAVGSAVLLLSNSNSPKPYSRTAELACLLRFLSTKEKEPKFRTKDHLAEHFVGWRYRFMVNWFPWLVRWRITKSVPGGLGWVIARTNFYDNLIESTLQNDKEIKQVVLLGAGFDTRFSRLNLPDDRLIRMFEVDAPATQAYKRQIISAVPKHKLSSPDIESQIIYVPANFEIDTITQVMERTTSYDKTAKTLFLWEAVTPYLNEQAVNAVLAFVQSHSAPGSILAFDVRYKEAITGSKNYSMSPLVGLVGKVGEKYQFGVPEALVKTWIEEKGFVVVEHLQPKDHAKALTTDLYSIPVPDITDILVVKTSQN